MKGWCLQAIARIVHSIHLECTIVPIVLMLTLINKNILVN